VILAVILGLIFFNPWSDDGPEDAPRQDPAPAASDNAEGKSRGNGGGSSAAGLPGPESVPAGAELFEGHSGAKIGPIAIDGQSRFLSLQRPGVGVGNESMSKLATTWKSDGQVLSFGANLRTKRNQGRYGINLFRNGAEYSAGCAIEVGQTSCKFPGRGAKLKEGDELVIIIGEQGHVKEKGNFTLDWWFVFKPF
jgi:hypothetical protein